MKEKEKHLGKRILAFVLAFVLVTGMVPFPMNSVYADEENNDTGVTITVKDEQGKSIEGADIAYVIESESQGKEVYSGDVKTNENGTATVLTADNYEKDDLKLSASISMNGYQTDDTTIKDMLITSDDFNADVILKEEIISGITIKTLDIEYDGKTHDIIEEITGINPDTDKVYYKTNESDEWSQEKPEPVEDAGKYTIYVKIERDGFHTAYESGMLEAEIKEKNIEDITIEAYRGMYDRTAHDVVCVSQPEDHPYTVLFKEESGDEWTETCPKIENVGTKTVTVKVEKKNYKTIEQTYTAEVSRAVIDGITASLKKDLVYTGEEQQLVEEVTGTEDGDVVYYKINDGAWIKADEPTAGMAKDAGTYNVAIKVERGANYVPTEINLEPATVTISKAEQTVTFLKENPAEIKYDPENNVYDYAAVSNTNGTISYKVENDSDQDETDISEIAVIDEQTGKLTIQKGGYNIKITATVEGTDNYAEGSVTAQVTLRNEEEDMIAFSNKAVTVTLKDDSTVSDQKVERKYNDDNGAIEYFASIENSKESLAECGLSFDQATGTVFVSDLDKIARTMQNGKDLIKINITAEKQAGTKKQNGTGEDKIVYGAGTAQYTITIQFAATPADTYVLRERSADGAIVTKPNGNNDWFNTEIAVVPKEGYLIAKDTVTNGFEDYVVFDDQGVTTRIVYLKDRTTGEITAPVTISEITRIDSIKPDINKIKIEYSQAVNKNFFNFYKSNVNVIFTAYDDTSGIDSFEWKFIKTDKNGSKIEVADEGSLKAVLEPMEDGKYTATLTLPKTEADQIRGYLCVKAIDYAGNESDEKDDSGTVFVRDTISPTASVTYQLKESGTQQEIGDKYYFSNDVEFEFDIVEENFFPEDARVFVTKDTGKRQLQELTWSDTEQENGHRAKLTLSEEGDYTIGLSYTDRSGNEMQSYESKTIVIDKTKPVVNFSYDESKQAATIKVTEHNFRKKDIKVEAVIKNIQGTPVSCDLQEILENGKWKRKGDVSELTVSTELLDAIYSITFNYADMALNNADEVKSKTFVVDHKKPSAASVEYSASLLDRVLSKITFGYYNPDVTVRFTAYDITSGVDYFTWNYTRQDGISETNQEYFLDQKLKAKQDAEDKSKFTASITLPKKKVQQLRGGIAFSVADKSGNTSNKITDKGHVIVVDTISPVMKVEYAQADHIAGKKMFYNKAITAVFTVTEANFYSDDVVLSVTKDGKVTKLKPEWKDVSNDVHVGTLTIDAPADHSGDGNYIISVSYTDRSNNKMDAYRSDTIVVDTTKPVINVAYANTDKSQTRIDSDNNERDYYSTTQTATVSITEHNFDPDDVELNITAKDITGNELNVEAVSSQSAWTSNGDVNTMTITYPGDANYTFGITCKDQALNAADDYAEDYFTVDTSKPKELKVSYSSSVLDTILSGISFGFYNAKTTVTVTADDNISSVDSFKYSYLKAENVSSSNAELADQVIQADQIVYSNGGATATATFEVPKDALGANNQFNGTINFDATDRCGNESDYFKDTLRIIVDNIAPNAAVEYNAPVQTNGNISYYDADVEAVITVNEANFYAEDVVVNVTKNGEAYSTTPVWSDNNTDVHVGNFTLSGDGDYFITISYKDKSGNEMETYTSEQLTIDTEIEDASITADGKELDGRAFKNEVVPEVSFEDTNFESCEITLVRTSFADKNVDVTEKFITGHVTFNDNGGFGKFDTFSKEQDNDGIYTMTVLLKDKAGHSTEKNATFTVNRYGSVYEYSDYLTSLIVDGGAYVKNVGKDLVITEYNADRLVDNSLDIEISKDGKPLEQSKYVVTPDISSVTETGNSGWYQYQYTIAKENFEKDGVYKVAVSSADNTGNTPENTNYADKNILFRVDSTAPEINSITGLEEPVIDATEATVKYTVYDTIGLKSVTVYVNGKAVNEITDFSKDVNNYTGSLTLKEKKEKQHVQLVAYDLADNCIDTDSDKFESEYNFYNTVTISTNFWVRWYADKRLFLGTIGIVAVAVAGAGGCGVVFRRRRRKMEAQ